MIERIIKLSKNNSLLITGPRGSGKSTLISSIFKEENTLWIDLLTECDEDKYGLNPDELSKVLEENSFVYVVIDEVQKFPKLLDIVHREIEKKSNRTVYILSGSSARKLKRGNANLLAGRLFLRELLPFSYFEIDKSFDLQNALDWGLLPKIQEFDNDDDKFMFLRSYCKTYIREEVLIEQLTRKIEAFRDFLPVSAQSNGKIINYSKISKQIGINDNSVRNYFQILEDTLVGFFLPSFHRSIRKRQRQAPKFYFFDTGVKKALDGSLKVPLVPRTSEYGYAFEHFIILECYKLNEYTLSDFKFSYYLTKDMVEVDLIIERPGAKDLLVEIKSADFIRDEMVKNLSNTEKAWDRDCETQLWSNELVSKNINGVHCYHWTEALKKLFKI